METIIVCILVGVVLYRAGYWVGVWKTTKDNNKATPCDGDKN